MISIVGLTLFINLLLLELYFKATACVIGYALYKDPTRTKAAIATLMEIIKA